MRIGDLFNDVLFWYEYALYDGSITHPPCTESVRWMVLYNYVNIAENHVSSFILSPQEWVALLPYFCGSVQLPTFVRAN